MKKVLLILSLFIFCYCFSNTNVKDNKNSKVENTKKYVSGSEIYRDRMRDLIREVRSNTTKNKYLITQNGNLLYYRNNQIDKDFFNVTNGTTQESLYYGEGLKLSHPTKKESNEFLLNILNPIRKAGKPIFAINYGVGNKLREDLLVKSNQTNIINELLPSFGAEKAYMPIQNFNSNNINSLNDVKNFLVLLNPKEFRDVDDFYNYLKNTDYDLLLIEPSHSGKYMTKEQIESLKRKKNGAKRIVIAYFSIGEAGGYRDFWKPEWKNKATRPSWIVGENPNWADDYIVKYWSPEWRKIVKDYQKRLDDMGVDGYMLDTVDTYYNFEVKSEKSGEIIN